MKKLIILLTSLCIISQSIVISFAQDQKGLLAIGDSITSGYGLPGYTPNGKENGIMSFSNMLSDYLGYKGNSYENLAVDGQTTSGLLDNIKKDPKDYQGFDYITISIGGNDLIDSLTPAIINAITQLTDGGFKANEIKQKLEAIKNSIMSTVEAAEKMSGENIDEILKIIRKNNPNSFISIQTLYNPFKILDNKGYLSFINSILITPIIDQLNQSIIKSAQKYGIYVIDTAKDFNEDPTLYTNIKIGDVHPSIEGHMRIFQITQSAIAHFLARSGRI